MQKKVGFGTSPVFFTAISTILGAILFLRFGYAVGSVGFFGTVLIVIVGHLVTIPTAMAIDEIATNQKVEGGGEYYIISRSFGLNIGAAIGIALFLSQAISVAFYIIAFAEAFDPILQWIHQNYVWLQDYPFLLDESGLLKKQAISIPAMILLAILILTKGADLGVKALYIVVAILFVSLILFFIGDTGFAATYEGNILTKRIDGDVNFFTVFAIVFPAFTGMTAGVGLSGDLKDPSKSIPLGTLAATISGMIVYVFIAYKLASSASAEDLVNNQLIMGEIALWYPIIPIGLACATVSSALGSIMVAPRTLQAIGGDKIIPFNKFNTFIAKSKGKNSEPFNAAIITIIIAFGIIFIGDVNFVAEIISMFFMVTYGSLCLISFLQHFAADPSYRPTFRSRWYISLLGFFMCIWLMFNMNPTYAFMSIGIMVGLYLFISSSEQGKQQRGMAAIFQGVVFQMSRKIQVFLQKAEKSEVEWRPSVVCVSSDSFRRFHAFDMLRWMSHRYGFGTYIHLINGFYQEDTVEEAQKNMQRLLTIAAKSNVYLETLISPSYTSAIAQVIQLPGISGKDNNMIMFEFAKRHPENLEDILSNYKLVKSGNFDICILGSSERGFGHNTSIHIWIKPNDYENSNLMILLGYIISNHPDWKRAVIKIFAVFPPEQIEAEQANLERVIEEGRLPISVSNIEIIAQKGYRKIKEIINEHSADAALTIIGFHNESLEREGSDMFQGYGELGSILFVHSDQEIIIK
ncbi:MAG: amino acid permease [Chitinophagales bacterium]